MVKLKTLCTKSKYHYRYMEKPEKSVSIFYLLIASLWYGSVRFSNSSILIKPLSDIKLPGMYMILFFGLLLTYAFVVQEIVSDMLAVVLFAPCLVGLVILQLFAESVFKRFKGRKNSGVLLALIVLYMVIILFQIDWVLRISIFMGLLDYLIDFRKRFNLKQT